MLFLLKIDNNTLFPLPFGSTHNITSLLRKTVNVEQENSDWEFNYTLYIPSQIPRPWFPNLVLTALVLQTIPGTLFGPLLISVTPPV